MSREKPNLRPVTFLEKSSKVTSNFKTSLKARGQKVHHLWGRICSGLKSQGHPGTHIERDEDKTYCQLIEKNTARQHAAVYYTWCYEGGGGSTTSDYIIPRKKVLLSNYIYI